MTLRASEAYSELIEKAAWSHAHGRATAHLAAPDVVSARLFSYGFRAQTIGVFHATQVVLQSQAQREIAAYARDSLQRACELLDQIAARAMDPICGDHRALISTLHFYDRAIHQVDELMNRADEFGTQAELVKIHDRFLANIERVTSGNGIYIANDLELPEQGVFVVPDLDISIAPFIYGDYHSWNGAFLLGARPGVAVHRHHRGAEIHLGYSPVRGQTILGDRFSEVEEGYAMPIPPMTDHGFFNTSGEDHVVPFVFGSMQAGGWGVFFDVEARPGEQQKRKQAPLESEAMNQSVLLERAIREIQHSSAWKREVLIPAHRAGSRAIGGLELAITHGGPDSCEIDSEHYRIISLRSGRVRVQIGKAEAEAAAHDYFGIPARVKCRLTPIGQEPLVFLDAMIRPVESPGSGE